MSGQDPKNILVTGGTGFLGSRLVERFLADGNTVRIVGRTQRSKGSHDRARLPLLEFVELDLCDLSANFDAFAGQDLVVHTAAMVHATTPAERALQERVNVEATRCVIDACRHNGVRRLIHVSTTAALGISEDENAPADEDFRFNLDHVHLSYVHTKRQAEWLVLEARRSDFETVTVNPGFMFGAHRDGYRGGEVIERILRRRVVPCTNGGLSIVHVEDVADGIHRLAIAAAPGPRYILSGENLSFRDIAKQIRRVSGRRSIIVPIPESVRGVACLYTKIRLGSDAASRHPICRDRRFAYPYYSSDKARRELGYHPRPFTSIVADALDYLRPVG